MNERLLHAFQSCSLEQINNSGLFRNRVDRKYVLPVEALEELLLYCQPYYQILEIKSIRSFSYQTDYYDTAMLTTYHLHHNGRGNRFKIRERSYINTGLHYVEVKKRNHKGATEKVRLEGSGVREAGTMIQAETGLSSKELIHTLRSRYTRISLLHKTENEKVTIDLDLSFSHQEKNLLLPHILMVEIKTPSRNESQLVSYMKRNGFRQGSLSKYCLGLIGLNPDLKHNRFKKSFTKILNKNKHGHSRILQQ